MSRVKGYGLIEPEGGVDRNLSGTAGIFSSQEIFLEALFVFFAALTARTTSGSKKRAHAAKKYTIFSKKFNKSVDNLNSIRYNIFINLYYYVDFL